jgi:ribosomal protein RSM22 (predicted rRNA methylase)
MWSFPSGWEELIWAAARAELPAAALEPRVLAAAIDARSHLYTAGRASLGAPLTGAAGERDLAARAVFFTVADAMKVAIPIAELRGRGLLPPSPLRVLDVGAGVGAMTFGVSAALPDRSCRVTAVDRDARALALLRRVTAALPVEVVTLTADVTRPPPDGPFDLVVAGSVLNELPAGEHRPLLDRLLARVTDEGAVIVVEPALRDTARALHRLRDELIAAGAAHVFAPCTRRGPCPALDDPRDWCHEDRPFAAPPRLASLMHRTGLRPGGLKFAYLTLRKRPEPLVAAAVPALRVVSGPLDQKGTIERIVCSDDGRRRLRVLKRDRSDDNRALGEARRGDVILAAADGAVLARVEPARPGT